MVNSECDDFLNNLMFDIYYRYNKTIDIKWNEKTDEFYIGLKAYSKEKYSYSDFGKPLLNEITNLIKKSDKQSKKVFKVAYPMIKNSVFLKYINGCNLPSHTKVLKLGILVNRKMEGDFHIMKLAVVEFPPKYLSKIGINFYKRGKK